METNVQKSKNACTCPQEDQDRNAKSFPYHRKLRQLVQDAIDDTDHTHCARQWPDKVE